MRARGSRSAPRLSITQQSELWGVTDHAEPLGLGELGGAQSLLLLCCSYFKSHGEIFSHSDFNVSVSRLRLEIKRPVDVFLESREKFQ